MSKPSFASPAPIEPLESRTLFAATPATSFTAVLARVQDVAVTQLRLSEQAEQAAVSLSTARQAVVDAGAKGKAALAADRAAVRAAGNDPDALQAARAELAADRARVKADVLAAKAQLKQSQGDARAAQQALRAATRETTATLNAELKSVDGRSRAAVRKLVRDVQASQVGSDVTSAELQKLADDFRAAADGATEPSAESVNTLRANAIVALIDSTLTDAEEATLLNDLRNIMLTANVPVPEADAVVADVGVILGKISIPPDQMAVLVEDVQNVLDAFSRSSA